MADVEEIWHSIELPYENLFAWLDGTADRPDPGDTPVFRPVMLAHPLEDGDLARLAPAEWVTEWKWDGIRVQLAGNGQRLAAVFTHR